MAAPALLVLNVLYFLFGFVPILLSEWFIYRYIGRLSWKEAFLDSVSVNIRSTLAVGLGLPFAIAMVTAPLGSFPLGGFLGEVGTFLTQLGTWMNGYDPPQVALWMTLCWEVVLFICTVRLEGKLLAKRWTARSGILIKPLALSLWANGISWLGLAILVVLDFLGKVEILGFGVN